jgi:hypothetical protein
MLPIEKAEGLTPIQLRGIALDALVDARTLERALRGERVQHLTRERIRRALAARELLHLLPGAAR